MGINYWKYLLLLMSITFIGFSITEGNDFLIIGLLFGVYAKLEHMSERKEK